MYDLEDELKELPHIQIKKLKEVEHNEPEQGFVYSVIGLVSDENSEDYYLVSPMGNKLWFPMATYSPTKVKITALSVLIQELAKLGDLQVDSIHDAITRDVLKSPYGDKTMITYVYRLSYDFNDHALNNDVELKTLDELKLECPTNLIPLLDRLRDLRL